jgi:hypothetical protein
MERAYHTFALEIDGQPMTVRFCPHYFPGHGHLEFLSPHGPDRRIPVSGTGYRRAWKPTPERWRSPSSRAAESAAARPKPPVSSRSSDTRKGPAPRPFPPTSRGRPPPPVRPPPPGGARGVCSSQ